MATTKSTTTSRRALHAAAALVLTFAVAACQPGQKERPTAGGGTPTAGVATTQPPSSVETEAAPSSHPKPSAELPTDSPSGGATVFIPWPDQPIEPEGPPEPPAPVDPDAPTSERAWIQTLINMCAEGQLAACSEARYWMPEDDPVHGWAAACGGLTEPDPGEELCVDYAVSPLADYGARGTDEYLEVLAERCERSQLEGCDQLRFESPAGSEYEALAISCGGNFDATDRWCLLDGSPLDREVYFGSNPELDGLWTACFSEEMAACDQLRASAKRLTDYWDFGSTCGGYFAVDAPHQGCAREFGQA